MNKSTILNKLKLLDIRNPWRVSIVHELSNRRGASANINPLFRDVKKRMKAGRDDGAKRLFNKAVVDLTHFGLLFEKETLSGKRIHLLKSVWQLEDAIIMSISTSTIALSKGRRTSIRWKTILKEVRKELSSHNIILPTKVTKTLVCYFLLKRCGWLLNADKELVSPKKSHSKLSELPEHQHDLFC